MTRLLLAALIFSFSIVPAAPALARPAFSAGVVYSTAAEGLWIVAYGLITGCQTGFAIGQSGQSQYKVTILTSGQQICPHIARYTSAARFFPMSATPHAVFIISPGTTYPQPFAVGDTEPHKT